MGATNSREGRRPTQSLEVEIVEPPSMVSERLRLKPGELTAVRRRLRSINGEPVNIADSYYPLWMVQGTEVIIPKTYPKESVGFLLSKVMSSGCRR